MKRSLLSLAMLVSYLLSGCSFPKVVNAPTPASAPGCLPPPVVTVPWLMGQPRAAMGQGRIPRPQIPVWWQKQFTYISNLGNEYDYDGVDAVASDDTNLWASLGRRILRYNLQTGNTKDYFISGRVNKVFSTFDIFITQDGAVWSLVYEPEATLLALVRYNPELDQFELVSDQEHILDRAGQNNSGAVFFVDSQVLAETTDGKLLMAFGKNIITYDPHTNLAQYLLPMDFQFSIAAIAVSNNMVWFTVGQDMNLRNIDLDTGKVTDYGPAPKTLNEHEWSYLIPDSYHRIGVDARGRIWMGYFARLKLDKSGHYSWEQLTYPPELVIADDPDYIYLWANVNSIYVSQKGDLWFETGGGLIKYDVAQDRWCMSASISFASPMGISEDKQGNLWLIVNSSRKGHDIYKYSFTNP